MDNDTRERVIEEIKKSFELHMEIISKFRELLLLIKFEKDKIVNFLITYQPNNQNGYWEMQLSKIIESEQQINDSLSLISNFSNEFNDEVKVKTFIPQYLNLIKKEIDNKGDFSESKQHLEYLKQSIQSFIVNTLDKTNYHKFYTSINFICT